MHQKKLPLSDLCKTDCEVFNMNMAFKGAVLQKLLADPEWSRKLDQVTTDREYVKLIKDFAQAKGLKIVFKPLRG